MHANANAHRVHGPPPGMRGPLSSAEEVDPTGGSWVKLSDLSPPDRQVLEGLHSLVTARTMEEHRVAAERLLNTEFEVDNPLFIAHGRDTVRRIMSYAKFWGYFNFHPLFVRSADAGQGRRRLEMMADMHVVPIKRWWFPPTWLLPNEVHLKAVLKIGISQLGAGAPGKVSLLWARPVNLPALPTLIRTINGGVLSVATHWTEPVWSPLMQQKGDEGAGGVAEKAGKVKVEQVKGGTTGEESKERQAKQEATKRPVSAFMFYAAEHRPQVKEANPEMSNADIAKLLGDQWAKLSDGERQKFVEMGAREKERFERERAAAAPTKA